MFGGRVRANVNGSVLHMWRFRCPKSITPKRRQLYINPDFRGEIGTRDINLEIIVLCGWHLKPWNWLKSRT